MTPDHTHVFLHLSKNISIVTSIRPLPLPSVFLPVSFMTIPVFDAMPNLSCDPRSHSRFSPSLQEYQHSNFNWTINPSFSISSSFIHDATSIRRYAWAIRKSTSDWLVTEVQNREQKFIIWNGYKRLLLHIVAIHI